MAGAKASPSATSILLILFWWLCNEATKLIPTDTDVVELLKKFDQWCLHNDNLYSLRNVENINFPPPSFFSFLFFRKKKNKIGRTIRRNIGPFVIEITRQQFRNIFLTRKMLNESCERLRLQMKIIKLMKWCRACAITETAKTCTWGNDIIKSTEMKLKRIVHLTMVPPIFSESAVEYSSVRSRWETLNVSVVLPNVRSR